MPERASFGGSMIAMPNTIDFANAFANFADLSNNPVVFSTVISLLIFYVGMLIWSNRKDKSDEMKVNDWGDEGKWLKK